LEAIRDPEHERHDECKTWIGEVFDPTVVDANTIAEQLADLYPIPERVTLALSRC
jgi:hypothetical protein